MYDKLIMLAFRNYQVTDWIRLDYIYPEQRGPKGDKGCKEAVMDHGAR